MASDRKPAAATIRHSMLMVRIAERNALCMALQAKRPWIAQTATDATTPSAAASVGLARPEYIEPSTAAISSRIGHIRARLVTIVLRSRRVDAACGTALGFSTAK